MPAVPTQRTWLTDDALDSTNLNGFVSDPLRFLLNRPRAMLRQTVTQSLPNGVWTSITLTAEDVDNDIDGVGGHSTSTNTSRFTARYPGWVRLGGGVHFGANANGRRGAIWAKNGTLVNGAEAIIGASPTSATGVPARSILVFLGVGDFVELQAFQDSGGSLSTNVGGNQQSSMAITWEGM